VRLQSVVLPDNAAWVFQYVDSPSGDPAGTNYGTLSNITFPTGGSISYTYENNSIYGPDNWSRWVTSRTVTDETGSHTWNYTWSPNQWVKVQDPDLNSTVHTYTLLGISPYISESQYNQGSSGLLKTVTTSYRTDLLTNVYFTSASVGYALPATETTTWADGRTKKWQKTYDSSEGSGISYGNVTKFQEYDYGQNAAGPLLRQTLTSYQAFQHSSYLAYNLLNLPSSVTIQDGSGNQMAKTIYSYDGATLVSSGSCSEHVAPPNGSTRGNPTAIAKLTCPPDPQGGSYDIRTL
jgi:hypothetical protein